ncbi:hypothetical protein K2173_013071 [Erythroxylum novogranatense]|uniref:Sulfhydryl oxidase n=1 Tax=Erythroxylum novogranatense TaxID=1862640 RepID=A0AAV8S6H8_9ROSI|nr:hypothetical protein K2173_013071 [Erythroxylum novogranatense]
MSVSQICMILLMCTLLLPSSKAASGSRSILRAIGDENKPPPDFAVELNVTNFDTVLRDTPASFAVVEFFAHWCPACRNYKPHYEKVARLFNGPDAVHPGIVLMTRVDCALKANSKLCDKFSVSHYPMLFWGPSSKFVSGGWEPKEAKSEISLIDDGRTAERLLNWINKQLGRYIARAVYDVEEATSTAFEIIFQLKMVKLETRASLIKFLQLLVAHHPSKRCRKGSAEVLVNFDELCPPGILRTSKEEHAGNSKGILMNYPICGKEVPRGYWMFCRGSRNDTRGFSCGLWVLFHSLSVQIEDGESQFIFTSICEFIHNFFICEECRQHFYRMCSSVSHPLNSSREFALWLWNTHNKVNERLMKEESSLGTGDPKFPKIIWPPNSYAQLVIGIQVLDNLLWKTLTSLYKDKGSVEKEVTDGALEELVASTNAVVVPVGAALAIAFASCAFGALACYWRSQQKSRKPRRKPELDS